MGYWSRRQREIERAEKRLERENRRLVHEQERAWAHREAGWARELRELEREAVERDVASVERWNLDLAEAISALEGILASALAMDDFIDFEDLKETPDLPTFQPDSLAVEEPARPSLHPRPEPVFETQQAPRGLRGVMPGAKRRHAEAEAARRERHENQLAEQRERDAEHREHEAEYERRHTEAVEQHERAVAQAEERAAAQHNEVDRFRAAFESGDPRAIADYFGLVLTASEYPEDLTRACRIAVAFESEQFAAADVLRTMFTKVHRLSFLPESKRLVLEYELPTLAVVPEMKEYRYVKSRGAITSTRRPANQRAKLYADVIAQVALRTIHELFEADRNRVLDSVVFNGYVDSVDPRTGQPVRPFLVSVRTARDSFQHLDLARVEPLACLTGLGAAVSRNPTALASVRPVLEFSTADTPFTDEDGAPADGDTLRLLVQIARCPIAERILDGGPAEPCSAVVRAQWSPDVPVNERATRWRREHQLPEPWSGDVERARVLFVSSNPGAANVRLASGRPVMPVPPDPPPDPTLVAEHPSRAHGGAFPRSTWSDAEIADYFEHRFTLSIFPGGYHQGPDGGRGEYQRFWGWAEKRLQELIPGGVMGQDAALTELVRCKSNREEGVPEARATCTERYLDATLSLSAASVIIVVGRHAADFFGLTRGELRGPEELAGRNRHLLALAHPASGQSPKRIAAAVDADELDTLRALLGSDLTPAYRQTHLTRETVQAPDPHPLDTPSKRPLGSSKPPGGAYSTPGGRSWARGERGDFRLVIKDAEGRTLFDEWRVGITYAVALQKARYNARQLRKADERPLSVTVHDRQGELGTLDLDG